MNYEARHNRGYNFGLAAAVLLLSLLGFVANGLIPTESNRVGGTYPLVGWIIVGACIGAAVVFVRRAFDDSVQARVDERGVYAKRLGADPVPWADITGVLFLRAGIQRILRFDRKDAKTFGINTTFYDHGIKDLLGAVRHHRPDLGA